MHVTPRTKKLEKDGEAAPFYCLFLTLKGSLSSRTAEGRKEGVAAFNEVTHKSRVFPQYAFEGAHTTPAEDPFPIKGSATGAVRPNINYAEIMIFI